MKHKGRNIAISAILAACILVPFWMLYLQPALQKVQSSATSDNSPTKGRITVAVDRSLMTAAMMQARMFSDHYPDARVELSAESSRHSLLRLLQHEVAAVLMNGSCTSGEDSLMTRLGPLLRKEPVARSALACIVNGANPAESVSVNELKTLFSDRRIILKTGGKPFPFRKAYLAGDDMRLRMELSEKLFGNAVRLAAIPCENEAAVVSRIASEPDALGIIDLPSFARLAGGSSGIRHVRILPVKATDNAMPVTPSSYSIYRGTYPLVTVVTYVYDSRDALATGFGAWLAKEGQKTFERNDIAPFRQTVRTIILK
jgi:phosphate transport system substrate-binding protein